MLAYNGSIPGPTLRVAQGSEITVRVRNDGDHETTVHWHGLRLRERATTACPTRPRSRSPSAASSSTGCGSPTTALYWYHPHVREDYGLEMGLYGNILVDPPTTRHGRPSTAKPIVTLDDILLEDGRIAPFRTDGPDPHRHGPLRQRHAHRRLHRPRRSTRDAGEVVRFFFTNTANTRIFNVSIPGARMKLVGGDSGRCEREEWIDSVLLAPSERAVVDVLFDTTAAPSRSSTGRPTAATGSAPSIVADAPADTIAPRRVRDAARNDELAAERGTARPGAAPVPRTRHSCSPPRCRSSTATGDSPPAASSYDVPDAPGGHER